MALADYFTYEAKLARNHLMPLLSRHAALPESGRALDVGCGYGGVLLALKEAAPSIRAEGIELDAAMVAAGRARLTGAEIQAGDFFQWSGGPYDLILMRDVLEHIRMPGEALARAASMLRPGGFIFASFAPFFGPFGGHQHNGSGIFAFLPWLQLLPESRFRKLLALRGNAYKSRPALERDMDSVLETRLTLLRFRKAVTAAGLKTEFQALYLSRPDYRIKFGWPTLRCPGIPILDELFATGVEVLLQKPRSKGTGVNFNSTLSPPSPIPRPPSLIPANLRVNADDFGLSPSVSRAILEAARAGLVNSVSAIPFSDSESEGLLAQLAELPGIRIGAHLTFIEVPLLTRPPGFSDGIPPSDHRAFLRAYLRGRISMNEVRAEWKAQLDSLRKRLKGKAIHHLDSHQHIHLMPGIWGVAARLGREYGIPCLRLPLETTWLAWRKDFPRGAGLQAMAMMHPKAKEKFFGVGASMGFTAEAYRENAHTVAANPGREYELMVHPGEDARGRHEMEELRRWVEMLAEKTI